MRIRVQSYATMRKYTAHLPQGGELTVSEETTVAQVLHQLQVPPDTAKILLVNGRHAPETRILAPEDLLVFYPLLEGG